MRRGEWAEGKGSEGGFWKRVEVPLSHRHGDAVCGWLLSLIYKGFPKGDQPGISIGRTDAEAEVPVLWPPDAKSRLIGKDPDAGKDWRQEEKGTTEDEMVGWHHGLNGHEFKQTLGDGEGHGSLVCCSPWGRRVGHELATKQKQLVCGIWVLFRLEKRCWDL